MKRIALFAVLCAWVGALLTLRVLRSGSFNFFFLVWNLFLAAIPVAASMALEAARRRQWPLVTQFAAFGIWLAFLPNAPYIVTDLLHLQPRGIPLWFDVALLVSAAGTGLLMGYSSLVTVQKVVTDRFGHAWGWAVALAAHLLCGFGIYLGRFLRWNSWDFLAHPSALFVDVADLVVNPRSHPGTMAVTFIYGGALALGYIAMHVLADDVARDARATAPQSGA